MGNFALHAFEARFIDAWAPTLWCDSHVVLAVSGGADSVAMLRAALAIKDRHGGDGRLLVAHLNHGLRSAESEADAIWLKSLCQSLNVPIEVGAADIASLVERDGDGWETAARRARYEFLRQTAEQFGARFVAVAHTADDQVETVLHRILRGTGIAGLAGMYRARPLSSSVALIRPMLEVRRQDVLDYLNAIGQPFRTDSTNEDLRFTRNRLRHELLPVLRRHFNADLDAAILRLAAQAAETQHQIDFTAAQVSAACVTLEPIADRNPNTIRGAVAVRIDCEHLGSQSEPIVREVCKMAWMQAGWPLQAMGFDEWQQLAVLVRGNGQSHAICLPSGVRAHRTNGVLELRMIGLS
jgi:tRNA(Ile)-lysidine synthase